MLSTKQQWLEKYNCHTLRISQFQIQVIWVATGFKVSFCGTELSKRFDDLESAKQAGLKLAKKVLRNAYMEIEVV
jgi:hypothetical protein